MLTSPNHVLLFILFTAASCTEPTALISLKLLSSLKQPPDKKEKPERRHKKCVPRFRNTTEYCKQIIGPPLKQPASFRDHRQKTHTQTNQTPLQACLAYAAGYLAVRSAALHPSGAQRSLGPVSMQSGREEAGWREASICTLARARSANTANGAGPRAIRERIPPSKHKGGGVACAHWCRDPPKQSAARASQLCATGF